MAEFFDEGDFAKHVNEITLGQTMRMESGLQDYKDSAAFITQVKNPTTDYGPRDYLEWAPKSIMFEPGTKWAYSGSGYVLLGLAAAKLYEHDSWLDLDQKAWLPTNL